MFSVHWLSIRVVGCLSDGNRSPSQNKVGLFTGSSFKVKSRTCELNSTQRLSSWSAFRLGEIS